MQEDTKKVFAVLSVAFAAMAWFVLGVILAPLAVIFGSLAVTCKEPGYKAASIIGIIAGAIEFVIIILAIALAVAIR